MLNSPISTLLGWYSQRCSLCNTTHIEAILYSYKEKIKCPECKKKIIFGKKLFETFLIFLKMNNDDLSDFSLDKQAMATINALFRIIKNHGISVMKIGIPIYVVFDITNKCNLKCIHCYSSNNKSELSTNEIFKIIEKLYETGVGLIDFGGGEPLLRDDIFDILSYSKDVGLYISITTNGTLLNKENIKNLKKLNIDHVCISLDGFKQETHDYIRNKKGTYDKVINSIKYCKSEGIDTQISTVIMKKNFNELKDLFNLLVNLNVDSWYVYDFIPAGRGHEIKNQQLTPKERQQLFSMLQEFAVSSDISIKPYPYSITINSASEKESYFYKKYGRLTEFFMGCLTARWVCHISSNGDLHPCYLLPQRLGNLKQKSIKDIWFDKKNPILKDLRNRKLLKGNCGICKFRDVCGGCRARAFWNTEDYLESDNCWIKN